MTLRFPRPLLAPLATALVGALLLVAAGDAAAASTKESIACAGAKQKAAGGPCSDELATLLPVSG